MPQGIITITQLPDPIGRIENIIKRPNGLYVELKRVPLRVVDILNECRQNVTVDAFT